MEFSKWRLAIEPGQSGQTVVAAVESDTEIPTRFGPRRPVLALRCRTQKLSVSIATYSLAETVVGNEGHRNVLFRLRYDAEASRTVATRESVNHEAFLLLDSAPELKRIEKAKTLHASFHQFQAGEVEFSFNVARFEDAQRALREGCPATP